MLGGDYKGVGETVKALSMSLLMMTGAVKILSGISATGIDRALSAIESLSLCVGGLMLVSKGMRGANVGAVLSLAVTIGVIAMAIHELGKMDGGDLDNATGAINKVIGVLTLLSGALSFSGLSINPGTAIALIGVISILAAVVAALVVLQDEKLVNPDKVLQLAEQLTDIMNALTKAVAVMGIFGGLAAGGIASMVKVAAIIAGLALVIVVIKGICEEQGIDLSGAVDVFRSGIDTIVDIATELGRVVGGFINGIFTEAAGSLPTMVEDIKSFFDTMKELNDLPDLTNAFDNLSKALGVIAEAGWDGFLLSLENIPSKIFGMKDVIGQISQGMKDLSSGFKDFATNMAECNGITFDTTGLEHAIDIVKDAYKGGWNRTLANKLSLIANGKNIVEQMSDDMLGLAKGFKNYAKKLEECNNITFNVSGLEKAIEIVKESYKGGWNRTLANKASLILNGKNIIQQMGDDMYELAGGFKNFAEKMNSFENYEIDTSQLNKAVDAVKNAYKNSFNVAIVNAIGYLTSGKSHVQQLCDDMDALATTMNSFTDKLANFKGPTDADVNAFNSAIEKAEAALQGIGKENLFSNITTWLDADQKSMVQRFASDVRELSSAMNTFTINLAGFKAPDDTVVSQFKQSIAKAKEAIDSVMLDEGGLGKGLLASMETWAKNMSTADGSSYVEQFSTNVTSLSSALIQWNTDMAQFASTEFVVPDFSGLVTAINSLNTEGGLLGAIKTVFTGTTDFDSFKTNVELLGGALKGFTENLGADTDIDKLEAGIKAAEKILKATAELEGMLAGRQDTVLSNFGKDLAGDASTGFAGLAGSLKAFVENLGDLGDLTTATNNVDLLAKATKKISELEITSASISNVSAVTAFTENLQKISDQINGLTAPDTDIVESFKKAVEDLSGIEIDANSLIGDETKEGAKSAGEALAASIGEGIEAAVDKISSAIKSALAKATESAKADSASKFTALGSALDDSTAEGINKNGIVIVSAAKSVAERGGRAVKMARPGFYAAGKYLVEGLAAGIRDNGGIVTQAAIAMAKECLSSMKGALQEESPSKATYEMGDYLVVGMANGIRDNTSKIRVEASNAGTTAVNAVEASVKKLTKVKDILSKGVDDTHDSLVPKIVGKVKNAFNDAGDTANDEAVKKVKKVIHTLKGSLNEAKSSDMKVSPEIDTNELESSAESAKSTVDDVANKTNTSLEQALAKLKKVRGLLKAEVLGSGEELNAGTKKAVSGAIDLSANESADKYGRIIGKMKQFVTDGVNEVGESTNQEALKKVNKTIKILKQELDKGTASVGESLKDNTKTAISDTGDIAETESTKTAKSMATGIEKGSDEVTDASAKIAKTGAEAAGKEVKAYEKVGQQLAQGLAKGIASGGKGTESAASSMAQKALDETRKILKIKSPSRVTMKLGRYFALGFANGIWNNGESISRSTAHVGRLAIESIQHTVDLVNQVAHNEIDITPTVRPVVDLSEVRRSGSRISDYLKLSPSVTIKDNLGAISRISDERRNDTTNSDLLYALRDLKDSVNATPSNVYNVNGITYDDGSNVAAAVGSLIRAARIERRA